MCTYVVRDRFGTNHNFVIIVGRPCPLFGRGPLCVRRLSECSTPHRGWKNIQVRVLPRFFDQVGLETMYASTGNKHFFTKSCHRQTYQNYEQPHRTSQNSYFQSHFSVLKIGRIFSKKSSTKNIWLGDQLLSKSFFWKFWFLRYFIS